MSDSFRRLLGLAAVIAGGLCTIGPAHAQWGYPTTTTYGSTYYGSTSYGATGYSATGGYAPFASSRYSAYGPGYAFGGSPAYFNAPYHLQLSPYGYPRPYGYGIYSERGSVDWDNWSPFGEREITYKFRRNGTVRIDIDD